MATTTAAARADGRRESASPPAARSMGRILGMLALVVGAIVFLFPFYYMVIGALQREPQTDLAGAFPNPANLTLRQLLPRSTRRSTCARTLAQLRRSSPAASCCRRSSSGCWPATRWPSCTSAAARVLFTVMLLILVAAVPAAS